MITRHWRLLVMRRWLDDDWLWLAMNCFAWLWFVMNGYDWSWLITIVTGSGWLWLIMSEYEWLCYDLIDYCWLFWLGLIMIKYRLLWLAMMGYDRLLHIMTYCDCWWLVMFDYDLLRLAIHAYDWLVMIAYDGCVWSWWILLGCDWLWLACVGWNRVSLVAIDCDMILLCMRVGDSMRGYYDRLVLFDRSWLFMVEYDWWWPNMIDYGDVDWLLMIRVGSD